MSEAAVLIIHKYIDESLFEPGANWPDFYFRERSYSRWAAYEILARITENSGEPEDIIRGFIREMDVRMGQSDSNKYSQFIFSTAKDTAKIILHLYLKGLNYEQVKLI